MTPEGSPLSVELALALLAGYLAVVAWIVVPGSHWCHDLDCARLKQERKK